MKKKNRKATSFGVLSIGLVAVAVVLLAGSAVGSTRAAVNYYSENYVAEMSTSNIGVSLMENGKEANRRVFSENGEWDVLSESGQLLAGLPDAPMVGVKYEEQLDVMNSGSIDEYVRVKIQRYWTAKDETGAEVKVTELDPSLIGLEFTNESGWLIDDRASKNEVLVMYCRKPLAPGESYSFVKNIKIDNGLMKDLEQQDISGTATYKYDGVDFHLEVEVDAVQTHSAEEAFKSAWGMTAAFDANGMLTDIHE